MGRHSVVLRTTIPLLTALEPNPPFVSFHVFEQRKTETLLPTRVPWLVSARSC